MNDLINNNTYTVIRSNKRKTAAIRISEKGVEVRVPRWVSDDWVHQWLQSKAGWVEKKSQQLTLELARTRLNVEDGALFPYKGEHYPIRWAVCRQAGVTFECGQLFICITNRSLAIPEECVKRALKKWYRAEAQYYFSERLKYWQSVMGLKAHSFKVKDYKRRWGSCTDSGDITLNWRLIFAAPALIDYVVIHELAHLVHLNHGSQFWQLVEQHCNNWRDCRLELQKCIGWVLW